MLFSLKFLVWPKLAAVLGYVWIAVSFSIGFKGEEEGPFSGKSPVHAHFPEVIFMAFNVYFFTTLNLLLPHISLRC